MLKSTIVSLAAFACALASSAAQATDVQVVVSETGSAGVSAVVASWIQSQTPIPTEYSDNYFTTVAVWNAVGLGGDSEVTWYSQAHVGGFTNYHMDFNILAPVSYASAESNPTFVTGAYYGVNIRQDFSYLAASYTITAVPEPLLSSPLADTETMASPVAVPEPASWAMMLAGLGAIGLASRRRQLETITYG